MARAIPIKPSYTAWSQLSNEVQQSARIGIPPTRYADAVAVVAYGRLRMWIVAGVSLLALVAAGMNVDVMLAGASKGHPEGSLYLWFAIIALNLVAAVPARRTQRLMRTGMVRVLEEPVEDAPAGLSLSGASIFIGLLSGIAASLLLLAGVVLADAPGKSVFVGMINFLFIAAAAIAGHWYFGTNRSADIDETGIWLGRPRMHIPWTSIATISVEPERVSIVVKGPVSPIDRAAWRWNGRRHPGPGYWLTVSIATQYPEMVKWVARAYTDVAETDEKVLARPVRRTIRRFVAR